MTIFAGIHELPGEDEEHPDGEGSEMVFNTQVVIGKDGEIIESYRKVCLKILRSFSISFGLTV